ncbi:MULTISPECIES: IS3 family transposase [unclassified Streptomyces]|uniref:IS3 family transposase n=1 Tax=unclassified Streptomyces TaxID=2593676 RepID=UPI00386F2B12|nr:IS3 family transposase [Streptomyces sp. NBC_01017]WSV35061.1 IS3 family transposase [Streptomyces sp. NBC_01017]
MRELIVGETAKREDLLAAAVVEAVEGTGACARRVRQRAEDELVADIRVLHAASRGAHGAPLIHAALARAGRRVNRKKIERLMREHRVTGITRRGLTRQAQRAVFAADLVRRDFPHRAPGYGWSAT